MPNKAFKNKAGPFFTTLAIIILLFAQATIFIGPASRLDGSATGESFARRSHDSAETRNTPLVDINDSNVEYAILAPKLSPRTLADWPFGTASWVYGPRCTL